MTLPLSFYRALTTLLGPVIDLYLQRRLRRGKEDPERFGERKGIASLVRPEAPLVWLHGASNGETMALLPIVYKLHQKRPDLTLLVTSGTVSAAQLMQANLPERVLHQYVPVDRQVWVARFLDHWKPALGIFAESDLWPNLLLEAKSRDVKLAIVDGRISSRSASRWANAKASANALFGSFDLVLAASPETAERFRTLGARDVRRLGRLKAISIASDIPDERVEEVTGLFAGAPSWLAASTHPGEEEIVIRVHQSLLNSFPSLRTALIPRHPMRANEIEALIEAAGIPCARRSRAEAPKPGSIYLADSTGEMPLFYAAFDVTFLAGSLVPVGGHNPMEPAAVGTALILGPMIPNNRLSADALLKAGAAVEITNERDLATTVASLLTNEEKRREMTANAQGVVEEERKSLDRIFDALAPLLPPRERSP